MRGEKTKRGLTYGKEAGEGTMFLVVSVRDPRIIGELIEISGVLEIWPLALDNYVIKTEGDVATLTTTILSISSIDGVVVEEILGGFRRVSLKEEVLEEVELNGGF